MANKYPCSTCEHYRLSLIHGSNDRCENPDVFFTLCHIARRYGSILPPRGCGNGRRHSGYVSVWRRAWRKMFGVKSDIVIPITDFESKPHEAGLWR